MKMKLLEHMEKRMDKACCQDVAVLHINHCMDNSFYFNEILGRTFAALVFIAPPYNSRRPEPLSIYPCYSGYEENGTYRIRKNETVMETVCGDFSQAVGAMIAEALRTDLLPLIQAGKKLLVIEDGAYFSETIKSLEEEYPSLKTAVIGVVEQTTFGTRRCMDASGTFQYAYPCLSIAKSDVKMYFESIFIGQRIVEELSRLLREENACIPFHRIVLSGYGIVGRSVARALSGSMGEILVMERNKKVLALAKKEGHRCAEKADPSIFDRDAIWIGCVGSPVFGEDCLRAFLKGKGKRLYLASGSSREVEFEYLRRYAEGKEKTITGLTLTEERGAWGSYHYRAVYRGKKKQLTLLAEGRPVNFYDTEGTSLTFCAIDPIFTELLLAAHSLCAHRECPAALYLLGMREELVVWNFSEEELLRQWFSLYHMKAGKKLKRSLDAHPLGGCLRKQIFDGSGRGFRRCDQGFEGYCHA